MTSSAHPPNFHSLLLTTMQSLTLPNHSTLSTRTAPLPPTQSVGLLITFNVPTLLTAGTCCHLLLLDISFMNSQALDIWPPPPSLHGTFHPIYINCPTLLLYFLTLLYSPCNVDIFDSGRMEVREDEREEFSTVLLSTGTMGGKDSWRMRDRLAMLIVGIINWLLL